jgi:hypothetical protein
LIALHPPQSLGLLLWYAATLLVIAYCIRGLVRTRRLLRRCRRARALLAKFSEQGQLTAEEWREFLDACEAMQIDTELARSIAAEGARRAASISVQASGVAR